MNYNSDIDNYIANAENFAKPILTHWRRLLHEYCPEVTEVMKWSLPHFDYKNDGMCVIASYKNHCSFTFLKAGLMSDPRLKEAKIKNQFNDFWAKLAKRKICHRTKNLLPC